MKNIKKLVAIVIVAAMMLAAIPFTVSAAVSRWDGSVATAFNGGTGTEADPYVIASASQLAFLAASTNEGNSYEGVYFKLDTDVDLAEINWTAIGVTNCEFKGNFDGANHTISGMKSEDQDNAGLFGRTMGASIKNVTVTGSLVSAKKYSGAIAGHILDGTSIVNCHSNVSLVTYSTNSGAAGGIVGRAELKNAPKDPEFANNPLKFYNSLVACTSASNVGRVEEEAKKNTFAGGVIGVAGYINVLFCSSTGDIVATAASTLCLAGGVVACVGAGSYPANILFNKSTGKIVAYKECDASYAGGVAGRVGHVAGGSVIGNCTTCEVNAYEKGTQTSVDGAFGGVFGHGRYGTIALNNYTTMETLFGTDAAYLDDSCAINVKLEDLESVDVFTKISIGETLGAAMKFFAQLGLDSTVHEYDSLNAKMPEGTELYGYIADELLKKYDGAKELLISDIVTGLPTYSTLENAIYVADNLADILKDATDVIEDIAKNGVAGGDSSSDVDTSGSSEVPTEPAVSDTEKVTEPSEGEVTTSVTNPESKEPSEVTDKATEPAPAKEKGCSSAVVSTVAVVVMAAAAAVALKKKED